MKYGYVNSAAWSKINWTAMVTWLVGGAVTAGLIPPEHEETVLKFLVLVAPPLIIAFRSLFTVKES